MRNPRVSTTPAVDEATVIEIVERFTELESADDIAAAVGLSAREVTDIGREHGYPSWAALDRALEKLKREHDARQPAAAPTASGDDTELMQVPLHLLEPDPENPRASVDDIDDLAQSIVSNGLLQPIVARRTADVIDIDHPLVIVAGHRRYAALVTLNHTSAPVIVRAAMTPAAVLAAMLVENSQRRDLDPISEARAISHLMATRAELNSQTDVAQQLGRSQSWVGRRLALLELSPAVQDKVRAGEILENEAVQLSRRNSGRARPARAGSNNHHFGVAHDLADRAKRRCASNKHTAHRIGKVACGECWEAVIRADERSAIHAHSASKGECVTCGRAMP